jgi:hypothetical protein
MIINRLFSAAARWRQLGCRVPRASIRDAAPRRRLMPLYATTAPDALTQVYSQATLHPATSSPNPLLILPRNTPQKTNR